MMRASAAEECMSSAYKGSYSAVSHGRRCFVTYSDEELTWLAAAEQCVSFDASLASFDVTNTAVHFVTNANIPPSKCSWVGLVKQLFYWTEIQRQYAHALKASSLGIYVRVYDGGMG